MKAFQIQVTNWNNCPITITGNETASKARYSALLALSEIHKCSFKDIRVLRANNFDKYAVKLKDRFIEPDKIDSIFTIY